MDIRFAEDSIKELTKERIKALKTYSELQPKYVDLAKKWLARHFSIKYLQEELDIDSLSEEQCKRIDNCKDEATREHIQKDLPKKDVAYSLFYITPYGIGDEVNKQDVTVDDLDTYIIEDINTRIQARLDLYSKIK